jgi:septal ring factor EnvC (AmiA/AmiB activator)
MDPPISSHELVREMAATRAELAQLDRRDAQLQSALHDIEHDLRRCNDSLERSGWRSIEAETRNVLLVESRRAILDDRDLIRARRVQLTERLNTIMHRLDEGGHDD